MVRKQEPGLSQGPAVDIETIIKLGERSHTVAIRLIQREEQQLTLSLISSIRERLKPEFLFSDFMALMAPDLISILACSVAVAVSTTGWSERAGKWTSVRRKKKRGLHTTAMDG